jgi:uncharacterized membrane protein
VNLSDILEQEDIFVHKLAELVQQSINEEQLLSAKLIELEQETKPDSGQKLADRVASFGGSWTFITVFFSILILWIFGNIWILRQSAFDPYPFILLNLVLSCIAAIQAPIIMMSQNRKEEKDRRRSRGDFMINLKAEMEVRSLHAKIDLLMAEEMKTLFAVQQAQMDLLQKIEKSLAGR